MTNLQQRLIAAAITQATEDGLDRPLDRDDLPRISFFVAHDELHLDFFGTPLDEPFAEFVTAIRAPEISAHLASLTLRAPDEGTNGTRNWDLTALVAGDASFPRLRTFEIQQTKPADHNRTIVAADYAEQGVLGQLLTLAPDLRNLVVPSAPSADFFERAPHPLAHLSVDAGYDTQGFIGNLARSRCFPDLHCLEFGEYCETYLADYQARCTPLADYQQLFTAPAFEKVGRLVWRNPICTPEQINSLKALRPDLQLLVVRTSAEYVG